MKFRAAVSVALAFSVLASPAHAAQLDPTTPPATTGALIEDSDSYEGNRCSRNQVAGAENEVAAVAKFCWTFFRLDPAAETDSDRDYGVWWIQSIVKPKNGWCASKVVTQMAMSSDSTMHAISGRDFTAKRSRTITPRLVVDAEGTATAEASVQATMKLWPTKMATRLTTNNNLKIVWTGATRRPVAAAGGIEGSWSTAAGPPIFLPGMSPRMVSDC